ncbi:hypothetical protein PMKS-002067 [Pichia membranifaciens]|uniref:Uncharacterized protein n=1 Tax=Pichia membranifaciens TaxID=4926 RepID=A0A1Q2YG89_9ASCO|nr:hypothetical protein PMKS-002067 [Pichia membranifaciens]
MQHSNKVDVDGMHLTPILQQSQNMASLVKTSSNVSYGSFNMNGNHNTNTNIKNNSSNGNLDSPNSKNNNNNNNNSISSPVNNNSSFQMQSSPSHSKHLYHNLYSSSPKKEMKMFIPPLQNDTNNDHLKPLNENKNARNLTNDTRSSPTSEYFTNHSNKGDVNSSDIITNNYSVSSTDIGKRDISTDIFSSPVRYNKLKKAKVCKVCSKPIIGTLVRAMGNIYHVDCFTCYDCHKPCSDKFFAADIEVDQNGKSIVNSEDDKEQTNQTINVPLCEYDYFKRIDLICYTCNNAIRGSYITALGHKYHSEHFFCEICHKVFESDNYYANEGKIYCHFHYSKLYAFHCESCKCAILKQYVEIFRGGKQQQWHPECFMVHKFWNVDITVNALGLNINSIDDVSSNPEKLYKVETNLEKLTISIWLTLSEFEESCASLISEMLHTATTNNKSKGLLVTSKLVYKIRCLFKSIESLFNYSTSKHILLNYSLPKYQNFSQLKKEPRSLTSKIMSYLTFLRDIDSEKLTVNKYSHELLSLISTIAHFIKLISRNALMHALEFNRLSVSLKPTDILLSKISKHEDYPQELLSLNSISVKSSDSCTNCNKSIEDDCIMYQIGDSIEKRWHIDCFRCSKCPNNKQIPVSELSESSYNSQTIEVLCPSCASGDVNAQAGFQLVSRYMQLAYLLEIAIVRSKIVIEKRERKGHIKQLSDASLSTSIESTPATLRKGSAENVEIKKDQQNPKKTYHPNNPFIAAQQDSNETHVKLPHVDNEQSNSVNKHSDKDSYENKVTEITRRRSQREARKLNSANREIRKSVILEAPVASSASTEEIVDSKKLPVDTAANATHNLSLSHQNSVRSKSSKDSTNVPNSFRTGFKGSLKLRVQDLSADNKNARKGYNSHESQKHKDAENETSFDSVKSSNYKQRGPFNAVLTSKLLQNESSLTLDDIPRIVSSEQAREHRPNAFRFQRRDYSSAISNLPKPKVVKTKDSNNDNIPLPTPSQPKSKNSLSISRNVGSLPSLNNSASNNTYGKKSVVTSYNAINGKRYSEFSNNAHEYIRHIAAYALYDMFSNKMTLEECTNLIDVKKSLSFWEKIFGNGHGNESESRALASGNSGTGSTSEFKSGSATISGSGKGVFGVPLTALVAKYGMESDLGVGSHKVRIPLLIDELINVMRTQDVSIEGVFRLNGNIRRLRQLVEAIESRPEHVPKLENETPIQLAAVLKKFLRDLPIPLLTFKLYDMFILSQKLGSGPNISEDDAKLARKRERVLKLAYAMLPKAHRDLAEVLFAFLSWVSTFANIDDNNDNMGGSKMDTHNLATVITPNILYAKIDTATHTKGKGSSNGDGIDPSRLINSAGGENQFLAIEVVNEMIEMNDELSVIPEDLLRLYKLAGFDKRTTMDKDRDRDKEKNRDNDDDRDKDGDKDKNLMFTKDIMAKLKSVVESNPGLLPKF